MSGSFTTEIGSPRDVRLSPNSEGIANIPALPVPRATITRCGEIHFAASRHRHFAAGVLNGLRANPGPPAWKGGETGDRAWQTQGGPLSLSKPSCHERSRSRPTAALS